MSFKTCYPPKNWRHTNIIRCGVPIDLPVTITGVQTGQGGQNWLKTWHRCVFLWFNPSTASRTLAMTSVRKCVPWVPVGRPIKSNEYFYIAHISTLRMLAAQGVIHPSKFILRPSLLRIPTWVAGVPTFRSHHYVKYPNNLWPMLHCIKLHRFKLISNEAPHTVNLLRYPLVSFFIICIFNYFYLILFVFRKVRFMKLCQNSSTLVTCWRLEG
jgi:hypothetical protein